jgi:type I restriction enzyme S subunit
MRDGWIETNLEGIAEYINGYPFKPADLGENGVPVIRIKQLLDPNEPVDRTETETPERCLLRDGDIVFSWSGTLAVRIWNRGPAKLNQHLFRVVEKNGVYKGIIPLILDHAIKELEDKSHGTTMKHITKQTLLPHKVLLPPLPEQKRIVDLISSVDSYVEALRQQLESAKKSRNAVLSELLMLGGDDWDQYLVSDLVSHSIGGIWGEEAGEDEVDVQVVRSTEFTSSGYLNFKTGVTRSIRRSQLLSRELKPGDILLEKSGGGPTQPVGRVVFVDDLIPTGTVCSNFVLLIRPNQELVNQKFLFNILLLWHFNNRTLEYQAQTTGIRNLRTNDYLDQTVKVPSLSKQREIVALIDTFDNQIKNTHTAIQEAQTLRSGLLADLLSGTHEIPSSYDKVMGTAS